MTDVRSSKVDTKRAKVIPMRSSRAITGLVGLGAVLALAVGSASVAAGSPPVAQSPRQAAPQAGPVRVELSPGDGVAIANDNIWYVHGGSFSFSVTASAGGRNQEHVTVFVSLPSSFTVEGFEGERWDCKAVEGGLECTNPDVVVPREAWPALTLTAKGSEYVYDSIDAYVRGPQDSDAHHGVPVVYDTST
jgi:hypothetical protein